ncbi:MAG: LuxR C-terminal-related transcriptional regulator [Pseudomonadota bacterium]
MNDSAPSAFLTAEMIQAWDWVPSMIWVSDLKGQCCHVNLSWREFTGRTLEECLGNGWLQAMHPDDAKSWPEQIGMAVKTREPFLLDCRLRRRDGRYRQQLKSGRPFYDTKGSLLGFIGCCTDVTTHRQALDALRQASEKHRSVLANLRDAVGVIENLLRTEEPGATVSHDDRLTPRQREILHLIARGFATREIALQLHVSTKTVESHRAQLMQRLNIHDVAGLTRYAIRTGLVQPDF